MPLARSASLLALLLVASTSRAGLRGADAAPSAVRAPPVDSQNSFYASSRPPLLPTPLVKLPLDSIRPRGWLLKELELQAGGFHGRLGEISSFLRKENNAWLSSKGEGAHGWEEPVYWLKGFLNLAYLLRRDDLIAEAKVWIEGALASQKEDGWFGPDAERTGVATDLKGRDDLWPNMIALFCLQDYYEFSGDRRVLELMTRYSRYLLGVPEERFLVGYWPKMRGGDLLFSVLWLYNRTGDAWLLDLAHKVHRRTADWTSGVINWHNVNMSQGFGQPATYYLVSKDAKHRDAAYRNFDAIRELYGQVPGGLFGGDENCRPGFTGPRQAIETCGIVEMMLSTERLVWFTGDLLWADRCEDAAFNSLPAALTADLKALRYLTSPNHVLSDRRSKSPGLQNGGPMLHMNPHDHRCCQHNWGHGWPYLAEHLWFATPDDGLAAVFYSDSEVRAKVRGGAEVAVETNTRYPFSEKVEIAVRTAPPAAFPLYLRVPGWCEGPQLELNGKALDVAAKPLTYIRLERSWQDGDKLALTLPMKVSVRRWTKNSGSVSIDRGPLTFSLRIGERYVREGGTDQWPAWEIHPTTPWNYGLVLDAGGPERSLEVVQRDWPADDVPFTHEGAPIELRAKAKRIPQWQLDHLGLIGEVQASPVKSAEPVEDVRLIPMGAARLRISAFPVIGEGPDAHEWRAPPKPAYRVVASHCWDGDTVVAVADGVEPKSSGDHSLPRFTWWDHRGTKEWIEARFDALRKVSRVAVYWFDDTGRGACRLPASWRLLWRRGEEWAPAQAAGAFGVDKDRFNEVAIEPVETSALRIEVELREGFSGGILEWKVE